jgi:hypothetical protein
MNDILRAEDVLRHIKSLRQRWIRYVERIEIERIPKSSMQGKIIGTSSKWIPTRSWNQEVQQDLKMKIRKWKDLE